MTALGRLERLDLREIWRSEASDFTPWLAREDNLGLLSDALGIDLELEAVEQNVGPFRADILCKDTLRDRFVLVENQLERTDHTHLGQLVTYAAGLDAVTIVWIAAQVTEQHRAAMDWLNDITDTDIRFFALEVELWRIGNSPAAPKFNIVCKPNDWSRTAARTGQAIADGELTPTQQVQLEFWTAFQDLLSESGGPVRAVSPKASSWVTYGIGRTHFSLVTTFNARDGSLRVELYLSGPHAKRHFDLLAGRKAQIEAALGEPLDWQRIDDKRDSRICAIRTAFDPERRAGWPAHQAWIVDRLNAFHRVFAPIVRTLDANERGASA